MTQQRRAIARVPGDQLRPRVNALVLHHQLWAPAGIAARRPADPLLAALSTAAALTLWRRTRPP